jgi:hypothetical protein
MNRDPSGQETVMRPISAAVSGLAAALLIIVSAARADAPEAAPADKAATPPADVTVVAPRKPPHTSIPSPAISHFVTMHRSITRIGQLARWRDDICPTTVGLPPGYNAFVTKRVKEIAAQVGAPVKLDGRCNYNVAIIFTPDPQGVLDSIRKRHWVLLGFHYPAQLKRLATVSHPIQSWYATGTQGAGGNIEISSTVGGFALDDPDYAMPSGKPGSRLTVGLRSEIVTAVIVADARKVEDLKIGAVADYIAFLALAQTTTFDACGELPSITELMAPDCGHPAPEAITDADLAYLKGLYRADLTLNLPLEEDDIADEMQQEIGPK